MWHKALPSVIAQMKTNKKTGVVEFKYDIFDI
jgi:hypothetical protein